MEEEKQIEFRLLCYNPEVDVKPYFKTFSITLKKGVTILRAINYIKDNIDPTITYRHFCQAGICGSCAMRINGISKLSCTTQVWDALESSVEEGVILVEPLNNMEVIRDLVTDIDPMMDKLKKNMCWVEPQIEESQLGIKETKVTPKEFEVIEAATDCILCGACYSECSMCDVNKDYISPLVMLRAYRMNKDSRDKSAEERTKILVKDNGAWDCTHCYKCVEHCVMKIPIMTAIMGVRKEALDRGLVKSEGARHAMAFGDDIYSIGRLHEVTLPIRTLGIKKTIGMVPFALKMASKKRVPPLFPKPTSKQKEVKKMFKLYEQEKASDKKP